MSVRDVEGEGLGFKPVHWEGLKRRSGGLKERSEGLGGSGVSGLRWLEVHPENYMAAGGERLRVLEEAAERYPLSLHGVGLCFGGSERLEGEYLERLKALKERVGAARISGHLAWGGYGGLVFNDLLPVPMSEAALMMTKERVEEAQEALGVRVLVENPTLYGRPCGGDMGEAEFLKELSRRTGCGLLLDVNNVEATAANLGYDAQGYVDEVDMGMVEEIHVSGHKKQRLSGEFGGGEMRVDDHGSAPSRRTWELLGRALRRRGDVPVLVEWDTRVPALEELLLVVGEAGEVRRGAIKESRGAREESRRAIKERRGARA